MLALSVPGERVLQAEGVASAQVLRWESVTHADKLKEPGGTEEVAEEGGKFHRASWASVRVLAFTLKEMGRPCRI